MKPRPNPCLKSLSSHSVTVTMRRTTKTCRTPRTLADADKASTVKIALDPPLARKTLTTIFITSLTTMQLNKLNGTVSSQVNFRMTSHVKGHSGVTERFRRSLQSSLTSTMRHLSRCKKGKDASSSSSIRNNKSVSFDSNPYQKSVIRQNSHPLQSSRLTCQRTNHL